MTEKAYWIKRSEDTLIAGEKSAAAYEKDLKLAYDASLKQIKKEISAFYNKYADETGLSLTGARNRLKPDEMLDFNQQAKIYLDEIERLGPDASNLKYAEQLKKLSGKAYISRLDELKTNIQHNLETLSTGFNKGLGQTMTEAFQDGFFRTAYDINKEKGLGASFTTPGGDQLKAAVNEKWLGENYIDRIWKDKDKLVKNLDRMLSQEFVRGRNPSQVARDFADIMGVSFNNAKRLIRTELNYISNKGTMAAYEASGILEKYEVLATLDTRTSDICQEMDTKTFNVKDAVVGLNMPPFHPYCRSTTIPWFPEDEFDTPEDRVARDENGKTVRLGEDLSFKQWVDKYGTGEYKARLKKRRPEDLPEELPVKPKFSFEGKTHGEMFEFIEKEAHTSGHSFKEVSDAFAEFYGWDLAVVYGQDAIQRMAVKYGLADHLSELGEDPLKLDIMINKVTREQAKNRVLIGEPVDDIKQSIADRNLNKAYVVDRVSDWIPRYRNAFTPEEVVNHVNSMYLHLEKNGKASLAQAILDKTPGVTPYKTVFNKLLKTYKAKDPYSMERIAEFLATPGKYKTIAEIPEAPPNPANLELTPTEWKMIRKRMTEGGYMDDARYALFEEDLKNASVEYRKVFAASVKGLKSISHFDQNRGAYYQHSTMRINVNNVDEAKRKRQYGHSINKTLFHEVGHAIDRKAAKGGVISKKPSAGFRKTMIKELEKVLNKVNPEYAKLNSKVWKSTKVSSGMQDVLEGAKSSTNHKINQHGISTSWGHGDKYWKRSSVEDEMASELFAHMSAAVVTKDADYEIFKEFMPETLEAFNKIIEDYAHTLK